MSVKTRRRCEGGREASAGQGREWDARERRPDPPPSPVARPTTQEQRLTFAPRAVREIECQSTEESRKRSEERQTHVHLTTMSVVKSRSIRPELGQSESTQADMMAQRGRTA